MEHGRDDIESWKQNPWHKLPTWGKWVTGIVGVFILLGIGGAIAGGSNEDSLKDELATAEQEVRSVEGEMTQVEGQRDQAVEESEDIQARKQQILGDAKSEAAKVKGELEDQRSELNSLNSEVSETESYLSDAESEAAKSEISDGVWQVDVDYVPGTYESEGGGGCYWALLENVGGGGVEDIIENGGFNEHQILTIESPYFETSGCGTWHRTG